MMSPVSIEKMKELTKQARDENRIISKSEAFKMYPVKEEAHKGKLEFCLKGEHKFDV